MTYHRCFTYRLDSILIVADGYGSVKCCVPYIGPPEPPAARGARRSIVATLQLAEPDLFNEMVRALSENKMRAIACRQNVFPQIRLVDL